MLCSKCFILGCVFCLNVLYWDVFFALNEKILIEFNKQNIQIPYNRLVVQTLDEDGKVNVKKGVKSE